MRIIWQSVQNCSFAKFYLHISTKKCNLLLLHQRLLRPVHTRELAPETRSRVSTPTNTHEGACSSNTLRNVLPCKYPNQYTRGSLLLKHALSKQISVHTRELAPETDSCNRFAPGACSLISNQFDMREQNSGANVDKRFAAQPIFSLEIVGADEGALLRERVAGACCGSKLPRVYRPLIRSS